MGTHLSGHAVSGDVTTFTARQKKSLADAEDFLFYAVRLVLVKEEFLCLADPFLLLKLDVLPGFLPGMSSENRVVKEVVGKFLSEAFRKFEIGTDF